jgi:acetyl-CoA C-acetyltransferase
VAQLDPDTPVVIGVGEASERIGTPGYRALPPVELAAAAARAALADAGGAGAGPIAARIDVLAGIRQFEISVPGRPAPFGCSDNLPRSIARRIGADPRQAMLAQVGGQSPQQEVTELAGLIAAGQAGVALVAGAEAISTVRHLITAERPAPDWSEHVGGQLTDRGYGLENLYGHDERVHGLTDTIGPYALLENARRARLGLDRAAYARAMGELFAPFTEVAAANPHAAARTVRSATELITPTERNRLVADPYTRMLIARDQVNQGAAVLLASLRTAGELGVPPERLVYLHGHAAATEPSLPRRADLGAAPASVAAVRRALDLTGIGPDDLGVLDLYSCYPIAVFAVCDGLGLGPGDPRGLTVTGGLPFFGGPGNNYSAHAIAATVRRLRARPGEFGLVGANGGLLSKYAAGVYSTTPARWVADDHWSAPEPPTVELRSAAEGPAVVETYTVRYGARGPRVILAVRLAADGSRALAGVDPPYLAAFTGAADPLGRPVTVHPGPDGNRAVPRDPAG